ncbi:hypothetical protein [Erythrobacter sp.]|uniref:hypothetical protein n=1 Tax=Erythrobacter sp. TaxID=1042 RepID=UPI001425F4AA|nr:hypothetical protein [Erythrobacter sp.]QIQ85706.1 MAG: hypothetical protein G9473_02650 [Erythrobacter sp.]
MPHFPSTPFTPDDPNPSWWVKVVGMLQQNWALPVLLAGKPVLLFVGDDAGIFDRIDFDDMRTLRDALVNNGFVEFAHDPSLQDFLAPPAFPLSIGKHPNGFIYSSGRFWR